MNAIPSLFTRRVPALLLACGLATLLAACFILPGKFTSTLDIRKDGQFTYTYQGEIFLLAFSELNDAAKSDEFQTPTCYEEKSGDERECTAKEVAERRKAWDDEAGNRAAKRKRDAEEMRMFLGDIDPSDPKAADKFAEKLQSQTGWRRVVNKGNGVFDVDFATTSKLTHDFTFPTIEQLPNTMPFVQLSVRNDGTVRMDAPMFGAGGNTPLRAMMGKEMGEGNEKVPGAPKVDGAFTLTTDGTILSNNTDQGPQKVANGQSLQWSVGGNPNSAAPLALVQTTRK
jgi:hypothetical protein